MFLIPAEFRRILPKDPLSWPPNPGIFVPNLNGTVAQITSTENDQRLTEKLYLETLLLKRTSIQQIIEDIDTK